jgi:signal transduction histidine kinase
MVAQLTKAVGSPSKAAPPLAILIVDDSRPDRDYLVWQLRKTMEAPPTILEAETAADALAILAQRWVDVALVDYLLPDMNGLDLLGRIVEQAQGAAVLFMSGQGSERVAAEAIKHGAHDYFVKQGIGGEQLKRSIGQAIDAARRNREERASFQRLDRAHRELDHFVRVLSHDMKANFMLLDHSFRELRRSCGHAPLEGLTDGFSHVEACLRQSRRFLEDLVTLARTGQISMDPARVDLAPVVSEVLYEQRELIEERRAVIDVASGLPSVWCNEDRIKQVVTNVVRNALRHGCDGRQAAIRISHIEPRDGNDRFAWLSIHDNGPGIPVASREEIFLPGRRLPGAHETGSGMGLAIVRKIVEHYGGQAFVDPLCAQGTTFVVTLPRSK